MWNVVIPVLVSCTVLAACSGSPATQATHGTPPATDAIHFRQIPSDYSQAGADLAPCADLPSPEGLNAPISVTNQSGTIVGSAEVGMLMSVGGVCMWTATITVPDESFYTVTIGQGPGGGSSGEPGPADGTKLGPYSFTTLKGKSWSVAYIDGVGGE